MRPTAVIRNAKALVEANAAHNIYTSGITAINLPATTSACQVAISLRGGSVNETVDTAGAATFTRYTLGLSNYRNTGLLQNRMINFMGSKFETFGTRERTVVSISAGPKAIEELTMDALVPAIKEPMFFKYEMFHPWDQAKRAANCPVNEAFHQASFSGGLSNKLGFYGGHGSESPKMLEERDEILEDLARNFHHNHYGIQDAIVVGTGVSDAFLETVVQALQSTPYGNESALASKFQAGQIRIAKKGGSKAVVGLDVTGVDAAVASVVAAQLGGEYVAYSGAQVIQFSAGSSQELAARLAGLGNINVADAVANASLAQAMKLANGASAAVLSIAKAEVMVDVGSVDGDAVGALGLALQSAPKSMVVIGDVHAFPQNSEI